MSDHLVNSSGCWMLLSFSEYEFNSDQGSAFICVYMSFGFDGILFYYFHKIIKLWSAVPQSSELH